MGVQPYRYGLRLTDDIVIPEPGAALREAYEQLTFAAPASAPFTFGVPRTGITTDARAGETSPTTWFSPITSAPQYRRLRNRRADHSQQDFPNGGPIRCRSVSRRMDHRYQALV